MPDSSAVSRQILSGIIDYRGRRPDWELRHVQPDDRFDELRRSAAGFDAVIAQTASNVQARVVKRLQLPSVLIATEFEGLHCVVPDEAAIGRMGFDALRAIGLKSFAFCGIRGAPFSDQRGRAFVAAGVQAGLKCVWYRGLVYPHMDRDPHEAEPFRRWLRALPTPTGILTPSAELAQEIVHQCRQTNRAVPHEISVLAVDDDEILCEFQNPTISALDQNPFGMGRVAAELLDRMLSGRRIAPAKTRIAPRGVVHRGTTQVVHAAAPWLRRAFELIHTTANQGVLVADIARQISVSRRTLECAFAAQFGRSVRREIEAAKIEQAKFLLEQTDLKPFQIASRCGFNYSSGLSRTFRRVLGVTPVQYRQQFVSRKLN